MATLGTEENGRNGREVAVVERFKQESVNGLSTKIVVVVQRLLLWRCGCLSGGSIVHCVFRFSDGHDNGDSYNNITVKPCLTATSVIQPPCDYMQPLFFGRPVKWL